jgi:hypothetical protein
MATELELSPPPSTKWYRLATLVVAAGLLAALAWWPYATTRIFDTVEGFERTGPFGGPVQLDETGTYTFWIEGTCLSCHGNLASEYRAAATVALIGPDGKDVALRPAPRRLYNTARREGRALWLFDVSSPGTHRLSLAFDTEDDFDNTPPGNVAISKGVGLPVGIVEPMVGFAVGGVLFGAAIAGTVWFRRKQYYDRSAHLS